MLITLRSRPGTIGVVALFAQVPGQWELKGETYVQSSVDGATVFMLEDFISSAGAALDDRDDFTPLDVPRLAEEFVFLFEADLVPSSRVKLFTVEQGADNVDFSVTVEKALKIMKHNFLEREMKTKYDRYIAKALSSLRLETSRNTGFLVYALERYLQDLETKVDIPSVEQVEDAFFRERFTHR